MEENNRKRAAQWRKGEWPPEGHPWRELLHQPVEGLRELFRAGTWQALLRGVEQLRRHASDVAMDTSKSQAVRDEACGNVHAYDLMLGLEEEILGVVNALEKYDGNLEPE